MATPASGVAFAGYGIHQSNQYSNSNTSPPGHSDGSDGQQQPRHRRGYQACEGCRARKVACKMGGDVDNPTGEKCQRCARERKPCIFAPTRKKVHRPSNDDSSNAVTPTGALMAGMKRKHSDMGAEDIYDEDLHRRGQHNQNPMGIFANSSSATHNLFALPATPDPGIVHGNHSIGLSPQLSMTNVNNGFTSIARPLSRVEDSKSGDNIVHSHVAAQALANPVSTTQHTMATLLEAAHRVSETGGDITIEGQSKRQKYRPGMTTARADVDPRIPNAYPNSEIDFALGIWAEAKAVRAGWISPVEAMNYIEFFYRELEPMTPIDLPNFRAPRTHEALLQEEPILALVILMIASRHMPLQGPASHSRSHEVHNQLWFTLQTMIQRLVWSQEQFGGGFSRAGSTPVRESITGQITWTGSLRTLGTIDALLLLTDWQPRALHFPPGQEESTLVHRGPRVHNNDTDMDQNGTNDVAIAALEPGWRSDRMSWMLLGIAQSLAFELGVFDNNHDDCGHRHLEGSDCLRKRRLRRLVMIYVTQTSGRLGIKCVLSPEMDEDKVFDNDPKHYSDHVDIMQTCWVRLASLMYIANEDIFSSKNRTLDLTASNQYKEEIAKLTPKLQEWKNFFDKVSDQFQPIMRHILLMEYEYSRMFINSLGFNKVVAEWQKHGPKIEAPKLAQIAEENKIYIDEVRSASANLLSNVLEGFAEKRRLKNGAIRTYLRSFAAMVFTLKLFSLGNSETIIKESLRLLERITHAMESQVVDDVHISTTIAAQVRLFTSIVKNTLIRVRKPGNASGPPSRGVSRAQSPRHNNTHRHNQSGSGQANLLNEMRYQTAQDGHHAPSPDDPIAMIQARPMDQYSDKTFMMPPGLNNAMGTGTGDDASNGGIPYDSNIDPAMSGFDFSQMDWLALPLDNILEGGIGPVEPGMSGVGPMIGNRDMLEFLEPDGGFAGWNMGGGQQNGYGNGGNGYGNVNGNGY